MFPDLEETDVNLKLESIRKERCAPYVLNKNVEMEKKFPSNEIKNEGKPIKFNISNVTLAKVILVWDMTFLKLQGSTSNPFTVST